ncbi:MAG TPA: hypothetical protein VH083_23140 [Myxococcales bacterium]|nr:hypothetical protein [Myxococcales bacterium]
MHPWLADLRHDLLKRAVWPARDLQAFGQQDIEALRDGLLRLTDDEGNEVSALLLFAQRRRTAPPGAACDAFERAVHKAIAALDEPWPAPLHAVLALEPAFEALARSVEGK